MGIFCDFLWDGDVKADVSPFFLSYLGVTPPISTNESSEREKEVTVAMMDELRRQGTFESEEESRTR